MKFKEEVQYYYNDKIEPQEIKDVLRIIKIMRKRGYELTSQQAYACWRAYSNASAAGFLTLPEEDWEIANIIINCFESEKQPREPRIIELKDGSIVEYDESEESKDALFEKVLDWCLENNCFSGEHLYQSDECQVAALELVSDITRDFFKRSFKKNENT